MGENITTKQNTVASNVSGNLPQSQQVNDSSTLVKKFFNSYYTKPLEFNSNEVDATIGFFEKRGFDKTSAQTISTIIMQQAKIDGVKTFELLDTLGGFDDVQLSSVITEVLNYNRTKISALGYKIDQATNKLDARNIMV